MGYAEAEQEAAAGLFMQRALRPGHGDRIAQVDVDDAGGDDEAPGLREEPTRMDEGIAAERIGKPERAVSERLDAPCEFDGLADREPIRPRPYSDSTDVQSVRLLVR